MNVQDNERSGDNRRLNAQKLAELSLSQLLDML